jgi:hypothetical protein
MAWFLRVVEQPSGSWTCRLGLQDFDDHPDRVAALEHIHQLAAEHEPAEVFVHYVDGRVMRDGDSTSG